MAEKSKPETSEQEPSARESIAQIAGRIVDMETEIFKHVDTAVKEMSYDRYGHVAGNMTVQDVAFMLKAEGVKPKLATELARGSVIRHENFRWSEKGKAIQAEAKKS